MVGKGPKPTPKGPPKGPPKGSSRGTSGWSRLKSVSEDPLDSMGLPSRGDNRLLDPKTQEKYYTKIVERYMTFCSAAGERDVLLRRFASLDLSSSTAPPSPTVTASSSSSGAAAASASASSPAPSSSRPSTACSYSTATTTPSTSAEMTGPEDTRALSSVMSALRKLREGIVGSKRADEFSVQAYLFCIRLGVLVRMPEAYHPAILHLLRGIHPVQPLTAVELSEVVSYLVLDAACRRGALAEAFALRARWQLRDAKADAVLAALVHDDFVAFVRVMRRVDGHRARLMEWAEPGMRRHALKCVGKGYLSVDREFLERITGKEWAELTREDGVGWELEGRKVVIRRAGKK